MKFKYNNIGGEEEDEDYEAEMSASKQDPDTNVPTSNFGQIKLTEKVISGEEECKYAFNAVKIL